MRHEEVKGLIKQTVRQIFGTDLHDADRNDADRNDISAIFYRWDSAREARGEEIVVRSHLRISYVAPFSKVYPCEISFKRMVGGYYDWSTWWEAEAKLTISNGFAMVNDTRVTKKRHPETYETIGHWFSNAALYAKMLS